MKLLNKVGDAVLAKLVPGIEAKAVCGRCNVIGRPFHCVSSHCCVAGERRYAQRIYDQCGNPCSWHCTVLRCADC
jgi:hypothetical protein